MIAKEVLKNQLQELQGRGLKSLSFYPGEVVGASDDDYYAEMSRLLVAIDNDEGSPLKFNDSRKKVKENEDN